MSQKRTYRDPLGGGVYLSEKSCCAAIERDHSEQLKQFGVSAKQLQFNGRNRLPLGTKFGKSVLSGRPTLWNESAGCYQRFTDDAERMRYRQIFLERMKKVHGKEHLLDDPDHQRRMLANRSISGVYEFSDKTKKTYTGKEEHALLKFLNEALEWPGVDVQMPAPQNFPYTSADGKRHTYIPDAYIETLNMIIEVKGEMHNGYRLRDIAIETAKDEILGTSGYTYVKVESQSYHDLLDAMIAASLRNAEEPDSGPNHD